MRILVVGNGFDLDQGLATSYKDFLNFCNAIISGDHNTKSIFEDDLTDEQKRYCNELINNNDDYEKIYHMLYKNCSLNYFIKHSKNDNWMGMEEDIAYIVGELTQCEEVMNVNHINECILEKGSTLYELITDLGLQHIVNGDPILKKFQFNAIVESVLNSLKYLVLVLEYYISTFINNTEIKYYSPDIIDFNADRIISFNYSNTYERFYSSTIFRYSCDHIHGVATSDLNRNRETSIVLGITDDLDKPSLFIDIEKFYQRISKKTDNQFNKWLYENRDDRKPPLEIMFFGHSLDFMDSDILKNLINAHNSRIIIVYYDDSSYKTILANLVRIFGKEETVDYINRSNPKIVFQKQKQHIKECDGGIEVLRDIVKARTFYLQNKEEIESLLEKIKDKVKTEDISYFATQEYLIDVYNALVYQRINVLNPYFQSLINISSKLPCIDGSGTPIYHNKKKWIEDGPYGPVECNSKTLQLINAINKNNTDLARNDDANDKLFLNKNPSVIEIMSVIKQVFEILDQQFNKNLFFRLVYYLIDLDESDVSNAIEDFENEYMDSPSFCVRLSDLNYEYHFEKQWREQNQ